MSTQSSGSMYDQDPARQADPHEELRQDPVKTRLSRVTLAQEISMVLKPAPYKRKVQIQIPQGGIVYFDEDRPVELNADGTAPPGFVGRNRAYWLPPFDGGQVVEFNLCAGQWLVGCTATGMSSLVMIVEPKE
jgi:hypothetical protein